MIITVADNPGELGLFAAQKSAEVLRNAIAEKGLARLVLSTGASQFAALEALIAQDVDWRKVEMFHLDEYIGLSDTHPASFIKYLRERFVSRVKLGAVHFVDVSAGAQAIIDTLGQLLSQRDPDLGLIGIGENGHIAFNDPPADFEDISAYRIVNLDEACRRQQLGEGWFPTFEDVPKQAVSMTVRQILRCGVIISAVPYAVKAKAVRDTLYSPVSQLVPASALKTHENFNLFLDRESASLAFPSRSKL